MLTPLWADIAVFPYEPPWASLGVLVLFILFLGGCVGSFLNVVIYRVPAGLSIVKPRSRCPRCLTPILGRDNVPVVGWLLLRGRCRFCKTPISARYPLVEAAAGIILAALCWGEAIYPGFTLPIPVGMIDQYPLFGIAGYHFLMMCGLGAAALMTYDGAVAPLGFWRVILLLGLLPPLLWPELRPIPFHLAADDFGRLAVGTADGACGALLGAVAGRRIMAGRRHRFASSERTLERRRSSGDRRGVSRLASRSRRRFRNGPLGAAVRGVKSRRFCTLVALARRRVCHDVRIRHGLASAHGAAHHRRRRSAARS
ncbi:MAG: prepilin peptidase [Pirellulales bacterium]